MVRGNCKADRIESNVSLWEHDWYKFRPVGKKKPTHYKKEQNAQHCLWASRPPRCPKTGILCMCELWWRCPRYKQHSAVQSSIFHRADDCQSLTPYIVYGEFLFSCIRLCWSARSLLVSFSASYKVGPGWLKPETTPGSANWIPLNWWCKCNILTPRMATTGPVKAQLKWRFVESQHLQKESNRPFNLDADKTERQYVVLIVLLTLLHQ